MHVNVVLVLVVSMSSAARLTCEVHYIVLFILQEGSGHVALSGEFSISAIEASLELPSGGRIHGIVLVVIVNHSASIAAVLCSGVIAVEVVAEQIDASLVFSHLVGVLKVVNKIILRV
jgi:hypothetical protein